MDRARGDSPDGLPCTAAPFPGVGADLVTALPLGQAPGRQIRMGRTGVCPALKELMIRLQPPESPTDD